MKMVQNYRSFESSSHCTKKLHHINWTVTFRKSQLFATSFRSKNTLVSWVIENNLVAHRRSLWWMTKEYPCSTVLNINNTLHNLGIDLSKTTRKRKLHTHRGFTARCKPQVSFKNRTFSLEFAIKKTIVLEQILVNRRMKEVFLTDQIKDWRINILLMLLNTSSVTIFPVKLINTMQIGLVICYVLATRLQTA